MLMPEPHHSRHDEYVAAYCRSGKKRVIGIGREVEGKRKVGSVLPMELSVDEMLLGECRSFTGVVRDITERNEFLKRPLREKERSEYTLHAVTDGIISINEHFIM